jgi:RHS repeat-associated protein
LYVKANHLGNVRAVVTDNGSGVAQTISYTDYYPSGLTMPGRSYQSSLNFPYGYQGQEKDAETGLTNFELRQYDPRIGRWYNPDPMRQHHSPYMAMSNNPVSFTDPDGGWDHGASDDINGHGVYDYMNDNQATFFNKNTKFDWKKSGSYIYDPKDFDWAEAGEWRRGDRNGENWTTGEYYAKTKSGNIVSVSKEDALFISKKINWLTEKPPLFSTPDAAAEDFVRRYNQKSFDEKREYLTLIVKEKKDNKLYYTYLEPVPGGDGTTGAFQPSLADYNRSVADAHTHQQWEDASYDPEKKIDWNNRFGEEDMKGNIRLKRDGYVGTPNGSLLKFDYKTKKITLISKDMPYDKNHYKDKKALNYENLNINYFKP